MTKDDYHASVLGIWSLTKDESPSSCWSNAGWKKKIECEEMHGWLLFIHLNLHVSLLSASMHLLGALAVLTL
jgi:hypothetical protein